MNLVFFHYLSLFQYISEFRVMVLVILVHFHTAVAHQDMWIKQSQSVLLVTLCACPVMTTQNVCCEKVIGVGRMEV